MWDAWEEGQQYPLPAPPLARPAPLPSLPRVLSTPPPLCAQTGHANRDAQTASATPSLTRPCLVRAASRGCAHCAPPPLWCVPPPVSLLPLFPRVHRTGAHAHPFFPPTAHPPVSARVPLAPPLFCAQTGYANWARTGVVRKRRSQARPHPPCCGSPPCACPPPVWGAP